MSFFFIDNDVPLALTYRGHGHVYGASATSDLAMSYANVDGGSAPVASDLVVWMVLAGDNVSPVNDLTSVGWTQGLSGVVGSAFEATLLGKVVSAGDLSSPPTVITAPIGGSIGLWVAYSFIGTISSLSVSTVNAQYPNADAPTNQSCDSSSLNPPSVAITFGAGGGNDGSPSMAISGAAADISFTSAANIWFFGTGETQFLVNASVGGANITFSKGDDGGANHMASGYVVVS